MILREVVFEDWKILLDARNDKTTRENSINSSTLEEEPHKVWLLGVIADSNRLLYIATFNGKPVGTVRADYIEERKSHRLSWTTFPEHRGQGLGKVMVKKMVEQLDSKVEAEIKPGNHSSIKIAEYASLKRIKEENGILLFTN